MLSVRETEFTRSLLFRFDTETKIISCDDFNCMQNVNYRTKSDCIKNPRRKPKLNENCIVCTRMDNVPKSINDK